MSEWFEQWFGEEYLRLYPHRDDDDAARAIALIGQVVPLPGCRVLDLACGPGRHAAHLAERGARVVGFDLSMPLLARARQRLGRDATLVRGDMRMFPFRSGSFDAVLNLFTSFGYFADDAQHQAVLAGAARLLAPGGVFVLDYFNTQVVRESMVPSEERSVQDGRAVITRRLSSEGRYIVKEIHLVDDGRSFLERVRMFTVEDLEALLTGAGLRVRQRFGDYDGAPLAPDAPRIILVAEAA